MTLAAGAVYNEDMRRVTELISSNEAAELLGVTRQNINVLVHIGRLPAYRIGTRLYFDPADVLEYGRTRRMGRPPKAGKVLTE